MYDSDGQTFCWMLPSHNSQSWARLQSGVRNSPAASHGAQQQEAGRGVPSAVPDACPFTCLPVGKSPGAQTTPAQPHEVSMSVQTGSCFQTGPWVRFHRGARVRSPGHSCWQWLARASVTSPHTHQRGNRAQEGEFPQSQPGEGARPTPCQLHVLYSVAKHPWWRGL